jgi:hypothetical protein
LSITPSHGGRNKGGVDGKKSRTQEKASYAQKPRLMALDGRRLKKNTKSPKSWKISAFLPFNLQI